MCGIIGQLAFGELDEKKEKVRQESMIFLGSELLQLTQERGKDATGVAMLFDDGNYVGLKMGIEPLEFISRFGKSKEEYGGLVRIWRRNKRPVKAFLGHCRKKSRGGAFDNKNNHPIKVGEVIGIHNGTLENEKKIFKNLACDRDGEVDSEAIFRLLHHYSKNGKEPFTMEMMEEVTTRLDGTYAVLGMSGNNPYQVCGFRDRRPLDIAVVRPLNLVICSSEKKFIELALFRYNKYGNIYMPDAGFPTLKKGDVEYKILSDDHAVIFDMRKNVGKDTTVEELCEIKKMPRTIQDGYEKDAKTYGTNGVYGGAGGIHGNSYNRTSHSTSKPNTAGSTKTGNGTGGDKKDAGKTASKSSGKAAGRIWNKKTKKYVAGVSKKEIEKSAETGNVEVDIATGKISEVDLPEEDKNEEKDGKFKLELSKNATKTAPMADAQIKELPGPGKGKEASIKNQAPESGETIEVDVAVDAEALEKAGEASKKIELFENLDEVAEALEVEGPSTLTSLPMNSLANRMKKFFFKEGFSKGYAARKTEVEGDGNVDKDTLTSYIRRLKAMIFMYENILRCSGVGVRSYAIERSLIEAMENGADFNREFMDKMFKTGDERSSKILKKIKRMVAEKSNR